MPRSPSRHRWAAGEAEPYGFEKELQEDVAVRAPIEPQAEVPRALGHRDKHDVHHADPAHQQRHCRDARQQPRHRRRSGRQTVAISSRMRTEKSSGSPPRSCDGRAAASNLIRDGLERNTVGRRERDVLQIVMPSSFFCTVVYGRRRCRPGIGAHGCLTLAGEADQSHGKRLTALTTRSRPSGQCPCQRARLWRRRRARRRSRGRHPAR